MSGQAKTEQSCELYSSDTPWYPNRKWWQSSRLFSQDVGLPPFLEPRELLQRSLAASSWPGYIPAPLFVPYISSAMHHLRQKMSKEQYMWQVSLDVAHFSPSEISLSVSDGFLEVGGKHEERPDEHGFIARCFTRKYRLPAEVDVSKIASTLSFDGILTVEAPVPESSVPAIIVIPIKVEMEANGDEKKPHEDHDINPDSSSGPDDPDSTCAKDYGDESPVHGRVDETHPDSSAAGFQQHNKRKEQEEETHEKPDGISHPSEAAYGEGTESVPESLKHHEDPESPECPDKDKSKQQELKEPDLDEEIQIMAGTAESAVEMIHPEEPELGKSPPNKVLSQELEAPGIKQEQTM